MRRWLLVLELVSSLTLVGCTPDVFETVDAALGDATPSDSGAVDAGCDGALPFCAADAGTFCADFDESPIPSAGWTAGDYISGYFNEIALDTYISCPHSVRMVVPEPDAATGQDGGVNAGHAWLLKDVPVTSTYPIVTVNVAARVFGGETNGMYFNLFEVRGGIGQSVPYVAISYSNTGWQLHTYNTDTPIASMPVNGWAMFSLVVTFSTTISATLTINSETPIIGASTGTASAIGGTVELALGISSTLYAPPGNYEYDNVLVEVQ